MDWQAVQFSLFFNHSLKDQVESSRNILRYICIVNSVLDKSSNFFFTFKFALSKSEAVLSMSGDFPTLLNGVTKSSIFTSLSISLRIFNLCLGIQIFLDFFLFGIGLFISRYLAIIVFAFLTFFLRISSDSLSLTFQFFLIFSFFCHFFIVFFFWY